MIKILRSLLRTPSSMSLRQHLACILWQRVLRVNGHVPWPVHFTSRVVCPERIRLGLESTPGDMPGCYIQGINGIEVGNGCEFGPGVGLISANHDPADYRRHLSAPPIRIGDRCWFGMNAIVLPGVELGPDTIVGAGAVVTRSYPQGGVVLVGNPARPLRPCHHPDRQPSDPGMAAAKPAEVVDGAFPAPEAFQP